jgi:transcriptional regulator with XRE-family HTH domain
VNLPVNPHEPPTEGPVAVTLGRRIASLRSAKRLTQQELAELIAISRVALSNLESGRSVPGERTVALLAGVFDQEPHELVADTDYPQAKVDRLPTVTGRYTRADMLVALCERDLQWLEGAPRRVAQDVVHRWRSDLREAVSVTVAPRERQKLQAMLARLVPRA